MQINRIVLNPAEDTKIYPNKSKPNSIVKLQRNPCKPVPINLRTQNVSIIESQYWIHNLPASANYTNRNKLHKISRQYCSRQNWRTWAVLDADSCMYLPQVTEWENTDRENDWSDKSDQENDWSGRILIRKILIRENIDREYDRSGKWLIREILIRQ